MRKLAAIMFALGLVLGSAASALADPIALINADFETGSKVPWGPSGGVADHASFPRTNDGTLGVYFAYYSVNNSETVGQLTSTIIQANYSYTFKAWAQGGGNDVGNVPFEIGYADVDGQLSSFVLLASQAYDVGEAWEDLAGVTYDVGPTGSEIGKELIVRLGPGSGMTPDDIWFDNMSASYIPEPASLALLLLGATALLRRRTH